MILNSVYTNDSYMIKIKDYERHIWIKLSTNLALSHIILKIQNLIKHKLK